jgi:hypothetical protein
MDAAVSIVHTRRPMEEEGLGLKFWAGLIGIILACGIGGMIVLFIFSRAAYAWGLIGGLLVLCGLLIIVAWFHDRRQVKKYEALE